ncbi:hypothetical protein T11_61, partial [Trichinella zimbabwensis]
LEVKANITFCSGTKAKIRYRTAVGCGTAEDSPESRRSKKFTKRTKNNQEELLEVKANITFCSGTKAKIRYRTAVGCGTVED